MEKEKCYVDGHGDVHCFIDEERGDCETFKEVPVDLEAEEWIRKQSYGGSAETWLLIFNLLYCPYPLLEQWLLLQSSRQKT